VIVLERRGDALVVRASAGLRDRLEPLVEDLEIEPSADAVGVREAGNQETKASDER
jgi:hypothetical protein